MEKLKYLGAVAASVLTIGAALAYAMQPRNGSSLQMWITLIGAYFALSVSLHLALRHSDLPGPSFVPKAGDLSAGVLVGLVTVVGGFVGLEWIVGPGTGRELWLFRIYAQSGDIQGQTQLTLALGLVVVLEELVWRRWVLSCLRAVSQRWAAPLAALAYALAHVPTYFTLGDPTTGGNPLILLAALGCGLIWGYFTQLSGRIIPTIIAHAVFSYFLAGPMPRWF